MGCIILICGVVLVIAWVLATSDISMGLKLQNTKTCEQEGQTENAKAIPQSLSVLSQNLYVHYFVPLAICKRSRIENFVEHVRDTSEQYDVLCLQEIFLVRVFGLIIGQHTYNFLMRELTDLGFCYSTNVTATLPRLFGQNSGVVIFSRYPITAQMSKAFDLSDEAVNTKGFAYARIDHPLKTVHIFNAHMDSRVNPKARLSQVSQVSDMLHTLRNAEENQDDLFVSAADWNICPHSFDDGSQYKFLVQAMSPLTELSYGEKATHRRGSSVDHIFANVADTKARLVDWRGGPKNTGRCVSDHYGLASTIQLS